VTSAVLLGEPLPVELMNTVTADRDGPRDALADEAGVAAWLAALGPRLRTEIGITLDPDDTDADRLRRLRDALRVLAAEATGDTRTFLPAPGLTRSEALATLNDLARAWPRLVWPDGADPVRELQAAGTPAERAVAVVAHQGVLLFGSDQRLRLRACQGPNCASFFIKDHSRREWCSAPCGNRARVQRHYRRHYARNGQ
jgi:predicted RNA-binding Zn ribbon-like protein